ncbi:MAG: hypothetical protein AAGI38_15390 [Bacteroidota bacterium]
MKLGLTIVDDTWLQFNPIPEEKIGLSMYCEGFSIRLDDIKIIAICPRLPFDDERLFVLLVNKYGDSFPIPDLILDAEGVRSLEKIFGLNSILNAEWPKLDYEDHYGFMTRIIYPRHLYGKRLYDGVFNSWPAFKNGLGRLLDISHSTSGVFTREVVDELANISSWDDSFHSL